jgi:hypothetical protein
VLVIDPARPEVEKELEQLYINFAQANRMTTKQCMVVAVARQDHPSSWGGERAAAVASDLVILQCSPHRSTSTSSTIRHCLCQALRQWWCCASHTQHAACLITC